MQLKATIRLRAYSIIADAIEERFPGNLRRFWKYREDQPPKYLDELAAYGADAVMSILDELINWNDEPNEE